MWLFNQNVEIKTDFSIALATFHGPSGCLWLVVTISDGIDSRTFL